MAVVVVGAGLFLYFKAGAGTGAAVFGFSAGFAVILASRLDRTRTSGWTIVIAAFTFAMGLVGVIVGAEQNDEFMTFMGGLSAALSATLAERIWDSA